MCIRIVGIEEEHSYNPEIPLEYQVRGAKKVVVNYEPGNSDMQDFMEQIQRIVKTGISCQMNIQVNTKNTLDGFRFERGLDKMTQEMEINEFIKGMTKMHAEADQKLLEMSELCMRTNK